MYEDYARLRDERGLTDYRVARETGVATATLSEWKAGTYKPKVDKLIAIAHFLGVPVTDLIGEDSRLIDANEVDHSGGAT